MEVIKAGRGAWRQNDYYNYRHPFHDLIVPLPYDVNVPLSYDVNVPLSYDVNVPLSYDVNVPLSHDVNVPCPCYQTILLYL